MRSALSCEIVLLGVPRWRLPARVTDRAVAAGPAVVQRNDGATLAAVPRVFAGYSVSDLLTAGAGLDLEITSEHPVKLSWAGGRINLERNKDWRLAAGIDGTWDLDSGDPSWRALFAGSRILSRGKDGRPRWTAQYAPTLDFESGKATHRLALHWFALRSGGAR